MDCLNAVSKILGRTLLISAPIFLVFSPLSHSDDTGLPLHGFADVNAGNSSEDTPTEQHIHHFSIGTIDLYLTPDFDNGVKSLIEIAIEPDQRDGGIGIDVERIQVGYTFSDLFTVWLGRFHTPYGYWNTAFHHGAQIQTSIYRPRFLGFEDLGGILPAHSVGLWGTGRYNLGAGKLTYDIFAANGSKIVNNTLDPNLVRDDNGSFAYGANIGFNFAGTLDGLRIGAHGTSSTVDARSEANAPIADSSTNVLMYGGYAVYDANRAEIMTEYYQFSDRDTMVTDSPRISSSAWYVQAGYSVLPDLRPYYRYERVKLDQNDNYFASQASGYSYNKHVAGVRYDLNPKAAVKFEFSNTQNVDRDVRTFNIGQLQYCVRF